MIKNVLGSGKEVKTFKAEEAITIHVVLAYLEDKAKMGEAIDRDDITRELVSYGLEEFGTDLVEVILDYLTQFD